MSAAAKAQLGRFVRLAAFVIVSALATVPAAHAVLVRYPLLGALVGVLEVAYRTAVPTQPAPKVTAVLADPPQPPGPTT